ncbi:Fungalysin metallopeptidase-domain-containing protein [Mycena albidolilacea]|uniref:Extracellular metalloproteinase n=1 Tax=Mycena albidolilacea TaxID=1033008 RepID=A0AAD6ZFE4_9AGAR|nr:Fungalysin metallopeptidase-domain-containing protein [Mycena albidolilacea]
MPNFSLVLLLGLFGGSASAGHSLKATLRKPTTQTFFPSNSFQTFEVGVDHPLSRRDGSLADAASAFVQTQLQVNSSAVKYKSGYSSDITQHAYIKQQHENVPFVNAVANVAFKDGKVVSFGHSFVKPSALASFSPTVSVDAAISAAEVALDGKHNDIPTTLEYLVNEDNTASLVHVVQVQNPAQDTWYEAFVDAHSGKFISAIDFVSSAAYRVLPVYKEYLTEGFELLVDPQDPVSSPLGWHNDGTTTSNDTTGNNAWVYLDGNITDTTPQSAPGMIFNYTQDPTLSPGAGMNSDAARTNVFYIINTVHDVWYKYGFTEAAFNFQQTNIQTGGVGGDRVLASVQNSSGINNAMFATPPDGQSGQVKFYLWNAATPERDGSLENDIVTHENTHGMTSRMTGGGTGRCLQIVESQGLSEGWSDAMADWMEQVGPTIVDFWALGGYVNLVPIRHHAYSTNSTTNPLTYSSLLTLFEAHDLGEVWANMLHNVHAALVDAHGFSKTARTDPNGSEGNIVWLHLFIDALALQPCQPTFLQARDAWIQADQNRYAGAHRCVLWTAFASRGIGFSAFDYTDDFSVPAGC